MAARISDPGLSDRLEDSVAQLDQVIRELRNYIFALRPTVLRDQQLDETLRRLAAEFERESGVVAIVDVHAQTASAVADESADILQLATEALSNIRRHAKAQTVRISLREENGTAVLEVEDDGQGFDPAQVDGQGNGLRNFRERTSRLGGELTIESAAGRGTTVRVALPL